MRGAAVVAIVLVTACSASNASSSTISITSSTSTSTPTADPRLELSILFVGNSHTSNYDVPGIVEGVLESNPSYEIETEALTASFLRTANDDADIRAAVSSGEWDYVVLQGQEISMSGTRSYSQDGAVALAEAALEAGSTPLLFAEWKREGVDETEYIEGIYDQIANQSGARVVPIGRAFDLVLESDPDADLWGPDGNHSSPQGAFLAASTVAFYVAGPDARVGVEPDLIPFLEAARITVDEYLDG